MNKRKEKHVDRSINQRGVAVGRNRKCQTPSRKKTFVELAWAREDVTSMIETTLHVFLVPQARKEQTVTGVWQISTS